MTPRLFVGGDTMVDRQTREVAALLGPALPQVAAAFHSALLALRQNDLRNIRVQCNNPQLQHGQVLFAEGVEYNITFFDLQRRKNDKVDKKAWNDAYVLQHGPVAATKFKERYVDTVHRLLLAPVARRIPESKWPELAIIANRFERNLVVSAPVKKGITAGHFGLKSLAIWKFLVIVLVRRYEELQWLGRALHRILVASGFATELNGKLVLAAVFQARAVSVGLGKQFEREFGAYFRDSTFFAKRVEYQRARVIPAVVSLLQIRGFLTTMQSETASIVDSKMAYAYATEEMPRTVLFLLLATGVRIGELLYKSYFTHYTPVEDRAYVSDMCFTQADREDSHIFFKQAGVGKKRGGIVRVVVRPTSQRLNSFTLLYLIYGLRRVLEVRLNEGAPLKQEHLDLAYKLATKQFKKLTVKELGFPCAPHFLRAVYANLCHRDYGQGRVSLQSFITVCLGHEPQSDAFRFYQSVTFTE